MFRPRPLPAVLSGAGLLAVRHYRRLARIDAMTGVLSAEAWRRAAVRELARAHRHASPAAILMIDIDRFKAVNDRHGHPAGDDALSAVGRCLLGALRERDVLGRVGGDEFAVLLTATEPAHAAAVAARLRARVAATTCVTVSIGLAHAPQHGAGLDRLIRHADRTLYEAKDARRPRSAAIK